MLPFPLRPEASLKRLGGEGWIDEGCLDPEPPMDDGVLDSKKEDGSDGCDSLPDLGNLEEYFSNIEKVSYWSQLSSPCQPQDSYINGTGTHVDDLSSFSFDSTRWYDNVLPENFMADSLSPSQPSPSGLLETEGGHNNAFGIGIPQLNTSFDATTSMNFADDNAVFSEENQHLLRNEEFSRNKFFQDEQQRNSSSASLAATSQQAGVLPSGSPVQQSTSSVKDQEEAAKKQPKSNKRQSSSSSQPCSSKKRGPGRPPKTIVLEEHNYSRQPQRRKAEKTSVGATKKTKVTREQHKENERRRRAEQKKWLEDMQSSLLQLGLDIRDKKLHHKNSLNLAAGTVDGLVKRVETLDSLIKQASAQWAKQQGRLPDHQESM